MTKRMNDEEARKLLKKRTKFDVNECYAKIVLEDLCKERYKKLEIKDKPDLQDKINNIGVELTSAISKEERELKSLWACMPFENEEKQERNRKRMEQLGVKYTGAIQVWKMQSYSLTEIDGYPIELLFEEFRKKIDKLNSGEYEFFSKYDLYVESQFYVAHSLCDKILERLLCYNNGDRTFSIIYLTTQQSILYVFDLTKKKYYSIDFSEKQRFYAESARDMVL